MHAHRHTHRDTDTHTHTHNTKLNYTEWGTSLAVLWLRCCAVAAGAAGSIHGLGTKITHAAKQRQIKLKIKFSITPR